MALQPETGLALFAPRGQTLSGTVRAPTPTCITCPCVRPLLQASLTILSVCKSVVLKGVVFLVFRAEVKEGVKVGK